MNRPSRRGRGARGRGGAARARGAQRGTTPIRGDGGGRHSLGGDQVEGRQAVRELLLADRRVIEVVMASDVDPAPVLDEIRDLAAERRVTVAEVARGRFDALARTDGAQGVLARAVPLEPTELEDLVRTDPRTGSPPFLVLLDGVTDPGNLGSVLRSAEGAGVTGVVLPRHRAAHVTPTVTKAAAGAIEHLPLALVAGLPAAMLTLSEHGVWTVGLDAGGPTSVYDIVVADQPIALVLGAEGRGLSRLVRDRCDAVVSIPLRGSLEALNVAAAAAVACFEIARRRHPSR